MLNPIRYVVTKSDDQTHPFPQKTRLKVLDEASTNSNVFGGVLIGWRGRWKVAAPAWGNAVDLCSGDLFPTAFGIFKMYTSILLLMEEILHQLIWWISHYLQGFIHPRWCRISSINSITLQWQYHHALDAAEIRKARGKTYIWVFPKIGVPQNDGL